MALHIIKML